MPICTSHLKGEVHLAWNTADMEVRSVQGGAHMD